jgi:hypothetical protein
MLQVRSLNTKEDILDAFTIVCVKRTSCVLYASTEAFVCFTSSAFLNRLPKSTYLVIASLVNYSITSQIIESCGVASARIGERDLR